MRVRLSIVRRISFSNVSRTRLPDSSVEPCPDTNTNPPARTAVEYGFFVAGRSPVMTSNDIVVGTRVFSHRENATMPTSQQKLAVLGGPKAVPADEPDLFHWPIVT